MKFILATGNKGKISEMQSVLSALGIEAVPQSDIGLVLEPDETGATFEENAVIKARAVCEASGMPAIADDSGLEVLILGGAPGVHSKRYGGGGLSEAEQCEYLLNNLRYAEQRSARFVSVIVCAFPDGETLSARGECEGEILSAPRGTGGFGYDPVFLVSGTNKSMAELSADEKNTVSHRGRALRIFGQRLAEYMKNEEDN